MSKVTYKEFLEIAELQEQNTLFTPPVDCIDIEGRNLMEVVQSYVHNYADDETYDKITKNRVSLLVNGRSIHNDLWPYTHLNSEDIVIITPAFGKNMGFIQAIIGALMIVAGILLMPTSPEWGIPLIIAGAAMFVGGVASMFFGDLPQLPEVGNQKETKTYNWTGIRSQAKTGVPVPIVVGTMRVGGYLLSLSTRQEGLDNYLYMLLLASEGPVGGLCTFADRTEVIATSDPESASYTLPAIYVNGQSIRNFSNIRWWWRNGENLEDSGKDSNDPTAQNPIPNFNDIRLQYDDTREILPLLYEPDPGLGTWDILHKGYMLELTDFQVFHFENTTAYRWILIEFIDQHPNTSYLIGADEIVLADNWDYAQPVNLCVGGNVFSSDGADGDHWPDKAFDTVDGTYWSPGLDYNGFEYYPVDIAAIGYAFGTWDSYTGQTYGEKKNVKMVAIKAVANSLDYFLIQASDDQITWVDLHADNHSSDEDYHYYTFTNTNSYYFYRIYCYTRHDNTVNYGIYDIQMFGQTSGYVQDPPTNLATDGTAVASSEHASYPASYAFDDNTATRWQVENAEDEGKWIYYDFGIGVTQTVNYVGLKCQEGQIRDFVVKGSNDFNPTFGSEIQGGIIYTTNSEVDAVELTTTCPSLYWISEGTGKVYGSEVKYKIEYKLYDGSVWTTYDPIKKKCAMMCHHFRSDGGTYTCALGVVSGVSIENCSELGNVTRTKNTNTFGPDVTRTPVAEPTCPWFDVDPFESEFEVEDILYDVTFTDGRLYLMAKSAPSYVTGVITHYNKIFVETVYFSQNYHSIPTIPVSRYRIELKIKFDSDRGSEEKTIDIDQKLNYWDPSGYTIQNYPESLSWENKTIEFRGYVITLNGDNFEDIPTWLSTGDTDSLTFQIRTIDEPAADDWIVISSADMVNGARSPIFKTDYIEFPAFGKYDVRIGRETKKSESMYLVNELNLDHVTEIINEELIYPNSALLGMEIKADENLSGSMPNITFDMQGIKADVPALYNGSLELQQFHKCFWDDDLEEFIDEEKNVLTWDGSTLVEQFTDNALYLMRKVLLNDRYGAGRYYTEDDFDDTSALLVAKRCHEPFDPYASYDFFDWWSTATVADWNMNISLTRQFYSTQSEGIVITQFKDSSTKTIYTETHTQSVGTGFNFTINLPLRIPIGKFNLAISLEAAAQTLKVIITDNETWEVLHYDEDYTFNPPVPGTPDDIEIELDIKKTVNKLGIQIYSLTNWATVGTISDISLTSSDAAYTDHQYTLNGVIESSQTGDTLFTEICGCFRCWIMSINDRFTFKIDEPETVTHRVFSTQMLEDSWKQKWTPLSSIPSVIEGQYLDVDREYQQLSRAAFIPLVETNKTKRQIVSLKYITRKEKIDRELKLLANDIALNCSVCSFKLGIDHLSAIAGDLIEVHNQLPEWGEGQSGRVVSYDAINLVVTIDVPFVVNDITEDYEISLQTSENTWVTVSITLTDPDSGLPLVDGDEITEILLADTPSPEPMQDGGYCIGIAQETRKQYRLVSVKRDRDGYLVCSAKYRDVQTDAIDEIIFEETKEVLEDEFNILIKAVIIYVSNPFSVKRTFTIFVLVQAKYIDQIFIDYSPYSSEGPYENIKIVEGPARVIKIDTIEIKENATYYFRVYARNSVKTSNVVYQEKHVPINPLRYVPPADLRLTNGVTANVWNTKDIVFDWDESPFAIVEEVKYILRIVNANNGLILRDQWLYDNHYVYGLDKHMGDVGSVDFGSNALYAMVAAYYPSTETMSAFSLPLLISNPAPYVYVLWGRQSISGAAFAWSGASQEDHKTWYVRTKITHTIDLGLIARYRFPENTGIFTFEDTNDYFLHLVFKNGPTWGTQIGVDTYAILFDSSQSQYLSSYIIGGTHYDTITDTLMVSAHFNSTSGLTTDQPTGSYGGVGAENRWALYWDGETNGWHLKLYDDTGTGYVMVKSTDTWMAAGVRHRIDAHYLKGSYARIFVDGVMVAEETSPAGGWVDIRTDNYSSFLVAKAEGGYWDGEIDSINIYKSIVTWPQIVISMAIDCEWSEWEDWNNNYYYYVMNNDDYLKFGLFGVIWLEVREVDWFANYSPIKQYRILIGRLRRQLSNLSITSSGGTGDLYSLNDGVLDSGGVQY